jgi:Fe-S cluster assembly protein SufD
MDTSNMKPDDLKKYSNEFISRVSKYSIFLKYKYINLRYVSKLDEKHYSAVIYITNTVIQYKIFDENINILEIDNIGYSNLEIKISKTVQKPILIRFHDTILEKYQSNHKITFQLDPCVEIKVVELFKNNLSKNNLIRYNLNINNSENSKIEYHRFISTNSDIYIVENFNLLNKSIIEQSNFQISGKHIRIENNTCLFENSSYSTYGINFPNGTAIENSIHENIINCHHYGKNSKSFQNYRSIPIRYGISNFLSTVEIEKSAIKSESLQLNKGWITDNTCEHNAIPELQIHCDDVKAKHGCTSSKINADQIFYLQQRGYNYDQALELIKSTQLNEILSMINDKNILNMIEFYIEKKDSREYVQYN